MSISRQGKRSLKNQVVKAASAAKQVVDAFPSFNELMNDPKYLAHKMLHPIQHFAFKNSQQWEGIAMAVNNVCVQMYGREFYTCYSFSKSGKGEAYVLPAFGDEIKVNFDEFCALIKTMLMSFVEVPFTQNQINVYDKWRYNDSKIYKILD